VPLSAVAWTTAERYRVSDKRPPRRRLGCSATCNGICEPFDIGGSPDCNGHWVHRRRKSRMSSMVIFSSLQF
jgi:hypothetical protein